MFSEKPLSSKYIIMIITSCLIYVRRHMKALDMELNRIYTCMCAILIMTVFIEY